MADIVIPIAVLGGLLLVMGLTRFFKFQTYAIPILLFISIISGFLVGTLNSAFVLIGAVPINVFLIFIAWTTLSILMLGHSKYSDIEAFFYSAAFGGFGVAFGQQEPKKILISAFGALFGPLGTLLAACVGVNPLLLMPVAFLGGLLLIRDFKLVNLWLFFGSLLVWLISWFSIPVSLLLALFVLIRSKPIIKFAPIISFGCLIFASWLFIPTGSPRFLALAMEESALFSGFWEQMLVLGGTFLTVLVSEHSAGLLISTAIAQDYVFYSDISILSIIVGTSFGTSLASMLHSGWRTTKKGLLGFMLANFIFLIYLGLITWF